MDCALQCFRLYARARLTVKVDNRSVERGNNETHFGGSAGDKTTPWHNTCVA